MCKNVYKEFQNQINQPSIDPCVSSVLYAGEGPTEDEIVGWHHRLDGPEFEQATEVGDGRGTLACCSPWGHTESDTAEP